jgi:hypothetical protein
MIRRVLWLLSALAFSPAAHAITQPNGTVIPVGDELQRIFTERGETLRVREDAAIMPERFLPGCRLTFTLVSRGASQFRNIFGWYNVRPGMRPDPADLHVLIPCNATAGNRFELNLRGNPDYRGGEIGFFCARRKTARRPTSARVTAAPTSPAAGTTTSASGSTTPTTWGRTRSCTC